MRIRGTPFITAVLMSAVAMLLIPDPTSAPRTESDTPGGSPAQQAPAATDAPIAAPVTEPSGSASAPPPQPIAARAAPGTARTMRAGPVHLEVNGFWSWALLDRRTDAIVGSPNLAARSDTASMVKVWIASDFLRRAAERGQGPSPDNLRQLSTMIRDSDNEIASRYHRTNGGTASITRMIKMCGLGDSRAVPSGSWSTTEVSARDGARLAACVADGRAAGPRWTPWVISEMRQVRGTGRFGVIAAIAPDVAPRVAIKNGWINRSDGKWHIACLAVTDEWALSVLTQYPLSLGMAYGTNICKQVAVQLGAPA